MKSVTHEPATESKHKKHDTTVCEEKGEEGNSGAVLNKRLSQEQSATSASCQVSVAGNTHLVQYSREFDSVWPSTDVVHIGLILNNCELNLWMWLCVSFHDKVFVNRSAPLSTPATFSKCRSHFAASLRSTNYWCPNVSICPTLVGPKWQDFIHVRAEVFAPRYQSHCSGRRSHQAVQFASAELRATTACDLHHILMRCDRATVYPPVVLRRVLLQRT